MENEKLCDVSKIIPVDIEEQMRKAFIEYAMSVIADRALPDVRDGFKPVHRRILYAMHLLGFYPDKSHRKCAATVGEVLGKFHPHGDAAVYDAMVRMAQDFSLRYPLIDGHGNFGSRDGDPPAAMRYTESRLTRIAVEMLADINKETVDFKSNFDDHEMEPVVMPSRFPNLLVNGSSGIAVGMATNIPTHNLTEVIDAIFAVIKNPDITIEELIEIVKGPDFPTYGTIMGRSGIYQAYKTGKGRIVVRGKAEIEEHANGRQRIIIHDLPYQVNKAKLIETIADMVKNKSIEGISEINDESDRNEEVRIIITLKKDANANVILNRLYKQTKLQDAFNVNMLALTPSKTGYEPKTLNLKQMLEYYIQHQVDVIRRRTKFDLDKAQTRAHVLEGLIKAVDILDAVIETIRKSPNEPEAKVRLVEKFEFTDRQAQAIVDMRLGRLTGLEILKLQTEYDELTEKIKYYLSILEHEDITHRVVMEELEVIKKKYGDERRTAIEDSEEDLLDEDLIKEETVVLTLTRFGYIKRTPVDTYKSQNRGGKGIIGVTTREEDTIVDIFTTSTHSTVLCFTDRGKVYKLRGFQIPEASRTARGTAIVNLLELDSNEKVTTILPIESFETTQNLFMATKLGFVKKTPLISYVNIRKSGIIAVTLREEDDLIAVRLSGGDDTVMLITNKGKAIKFTEEDTKETGRSAKGVIGIRLDDDDYVVGMSLVKEEETILSVTENGFGKRTFVSEYPIQKRAGKGVINYKVTERTGTIIASMIASDQDDLLLMSLQGDMIRLDVGQISILSRATQGVTLMRIEEDNAVVAATITEKEQEEAEE
ncbi:MAG: DNA gyrase subunit A [Firmicutes bacterium ADurb.Bin099]|jgi:DNA gyrase subunit A|nr:MAG: DNA gyrase subunit A [Firmicutes bacterium ADurb.Bin099]HPY97960.1 DNA gyrase subunit A [Clostridia bacterium]HQC69061.1 DNA gyrase subunit A [Clostridia bacterium]